MIRLPLKPAELRLREALDELANLNTPDEKPRTVEQYDEEAETASEIAAWALALLTAARDVVAERERDRNDFLADLQEAADYSRSPEAFCGVADQFRVRG